MREIAHSGDLPITSVVHFSYGNPKQMSYNSA